METRPANQVTRRRVVTGIVAGVLFVVAGWLSISASQLRWGDACAGGFDTLPCLLIQDHLYDYVLPTDPWVPIPGAAELAGLSHIVLALALALLFAAVRSPWWGRALQALLVLSVLLSGVTTVMSGQAGIPVEPLTTFVLWLNFGFSIGGLMALVAYFGVALSGPVANGLMPRLAWALWAGLLVLATPLPEYILMSIAVGYTSHDTTPWTGAGTGVLTALAGIVLIAGVVWNAVRTGRGAAGAGIESPQTVPPPLAGAPTVATRLPG